MMPDFHHFFPMHQRNFGDLELFIEKRDGYIRVVCPSLPNCAAEGETVREAVERIADKIARSISLKIRHDIRNQLVEMAKQLPEDVPRLPLAGLAGLAIGKFPVSLN